ncbi:MAG: DMT family transporter [Acidimicrobiia bacterium]|nr:DMT family transporter [Acidimicrobiia bacterium]
MPGKWTAAVVLAAVAAAWGTIPLIVRTVDLPAEQLVAARLWLGALPLLIWVVARRQHHLPAADRARVLTLGVVLAAHWAAFFWSLKTTTVAIALVLVYLAPVLLAALAPRILGEHTDKRTWVAVAMALLGVVLVARPGGGATLSGTVAGLIAAATLAALILIGKPVAQRLGGLRLAAYEHTVAALVMTPWALAALFEVPWEATDNPPAVESWWQLLVLGMVLTGLSGVLYWTSVSRLRVTSVGVIMYVEPASAVVWAALFLGETPGLPAALGVVLVILSGIVAAVAGGYRADRGVAAQGIR